jgi:hypothetical protein
MVTNGEGTMVGRASLELCLETLDACSAQGLAIMVEAARARTAIFDALGLEPPDAGAVDDLTATLARIAGEGGGGAALGRTMLALAAALARTGDGPEPPDGEQKEDGE